MAKEKKIQILHKPNWHPSLNTLLGDIVGEEGYITEYGTFELLGKVQKKEDLSKNDYRTDVRGPLMMLSAETGTGLF